MGDELAQAFVEDQRRKFREIRGRLNGALEQLADSDINWRPNQQSNSVANLVTHICGNLTQRYVADLGGGTAARDRNAEFNPEIRRTRADLLWTVDATFDAVDEVLSRMTPEQLLQPLALRDRTETVLHVIGQTATHVAEHLGQIIYIGKQRLGSDWQSA